MTQNERIILPIWKKILFWLITLIVFALQIMVFVLMFQINFDTSGNNIIVWVVIEVFAILIVSHIVHKPILTNYKLTWSILILILPLPFSFLYYLNHRSRRLPRRKQKLINQVLREIEEDNAVIDELEMTDSKAAKIARVIQSNAKVPVYKNTNYVFLNDGMLKFEDLMIEIAKAEKYIFIETFIIREGFILNKLLPLLTEKGGSGVQIKIIYDDLGSMALKRKTIKKIAAIPNCQFVNYNPLGLNINPAFNYRDHRKITIIDGKIAYCGGDNYADEYIHQKERFGFWRDNCGKYEGDAVKGFIKLFVETWYMSTKEVLDVEDYTYETSVRNNSYVIPFGDGPSTGCNTSYETFMRLISCADKTLYISTPYLVINEAMIETISLAAKSGVDVKVLMPGIPDKKTAFYLARYHYRDILQAGGKIYEYKKGFNHAKNIIVDNKYAFIGTINMDYRSMFLHYECGAVVLNDPEVCKMQDDFLKACSESEEFTYEDWKKRKWWQRLISYLCYLFAPMF